MDAVTRHGAQRRFRLFWILNAVPVAFLLEDILVLYGIRNGVPEPALAALASFVPLTMPFMLLGRVFTARWGLARGWVRAYLIRYTAVLVIIAAPWIPDRGGRTAIILAGAFVFAMFRAVGVINMHPLNGEITSDEDRGHYLHTNFAIFNGTYLLAVAATIVATRLVDATWVYQAMVAVGVAVGLVSLLALRGVPESGEGRAAAQEPFIPLLREVRRRIRLGVLIPAWAGGQMAFGLVLPFAVMFVKNGYGIDDHTALLFTLLTLLGSVASGIINRSLTARVNPASLVTLYATALVGVAIFWAFAPVRIIYPLVAIAFFIGGISKAGIIVGLQHYLISTNRPEHRMHVSLLVELTGSAVSGLSGTVIGGALLQYFGSRVTGVEVYHGYFRAILVVLVVALISVTRLRRVGAHDGREGGD
ncbi:MAG: MFS transporter [Alkalispirochaeta sp.]